MSAQIISFNDLVSSGSNTHELLFNLYPQAIEIEKIGDHPQFYRNNHPLVLLLPRKMPLSFKIQSDSGAKLIRIDVPDNYLNSEIQEGEIRMHICPGDVIMALKELINTGLKETETIKALQHEIVISCVAEIINVIHPVKRNSLYADKMELIKETVEKNLRQELPSLNFLAKQIGMTVSTMKRHFKMHFKINIYQYYLQKRMELARKLLEENLSVNETAEMLGYASVSNFIDTFKKYTGRLPGSVKMHKEE